MEISAVSEIEQGIVIVARGPLSAGLAREDLFEERTEDWEEQRTRPSRLREEQGGKGTISMKQREGFVCLQGGGWGKMDSR